MLQSSFSDIARVLSEFFRDLDVVPTDVIVGLVLLRHRQQLIRMRVVDLVSLGISDGILTNLHHWLRLHLHLYTIACLVLHTEHMC